MFVASSNVSPDSLGALIKRKNSRDLLHRYFDPRQIISFKPLVDQFATEVKTAAREVARLVFQRSVTTGRRVGNHMKPCVGPGSTSVPRTSPNVNSARC